MAVRVLLAILISVSVASLPATGEAVVSTDFAHAMASAQTDMPCCPSCNDRDSSKSVGCAFKCITLAGAIFPAMDIAIPNLRHGTLPIAFDGAMSGTEVKPPTHPPPV